MPGSVTAVILSMDASGQRFMSHMDEIEAFLARKMIPPNLRKRIRAYMHLRYTAATASVNNEGSADAPATPRMYDENYIVGELSIGIKKDLQAFLAGDLIQKLPFMVGLNFSPPVMGCLARLLVPEMTMNDEVILSQGDPPQYILFVGNGSVRILRDNKELKQFADGSYFGEIPFVIESVIKQPLEVRVTSSVCNVYTLSATCVAELFDAFSEVRELMRLVAVQRLSKLRMQEVSQPKFLKKQQSEREILGKKFDRFLSQENLKGMVRHSGEGPANYPESPSSSKHMKIPDETPCSPDEVELTLMKLNASCAHSSYF